MVDTLKIDTSYSEQQKYYYLYSVYFTYLQQEEVQSDRSNVAVYRLTRV
jgi:hypothetical protein